MPQTTQLLGSSRYDAANPWRFIYDDVMCITLHIFKSFDREFSEYAQIISERESSCHNLFIQNLSITGCSI